MGVERNGMMLVRAELCERLASLQAMSRRQSGREFAESVESLRRIAAAYGLVPVVRLAEALERAAAEGDACPTNLYLGRLQDAIGCERVDEATSQAMLASVTIRLCA
jgi:O-phosphoseryl-tRNA(Cys) synthetase